MELLEKIREAGVIGAGGAGFPTQVKLKAEAEYILLNGAECEPLLRVDQQLMALYPEETIKGFEIAGRLVGAKKAIMGIKGKHKEVIRVLRERIQALNVADYVEIKELRDIYPAGDEQVLVYELTGRIVPEFGIPLNVGCVVINSETALNVYGASCGKAVIEKYLTLAGDIPNRMTVKVLVGTPMIDVLKLSGVKQLDDYAVIDGGPMMGSVLPSLDGYITKKNKGFILLKRDHPLIRKKTITLEQARRVNRASCEQCRMCTDLCPRFLLGHDLKPHIVIRGLNYSNAFVADGGHAQLCCQCNLCQLFSCPAGIFPKSANMISREQMQAEGKRYAPKEREYEARKNRDFNLVPSKRLIARLGLLPYDLPAPMSNQTVAPEMVRIMTRQHVGAPSVPIVKVGESVQAGQIIGEIPENSLGATIHASVSGTVVECDHDGITIRREI